MKMTSMEALLRASSELVGCLDEQVVIHKIIAEAAHVLDAEACSVILLDEASDECFFYSASNSQEAGLSKIRFNRSLGIVGQVLATGKPVVVGDTQNNPQHYRGVDSKTGIRTTSLVAVPLRLNDRVIGVVEAINKKSGSDFTRDDMQLLSIFTNFATVAIANAWTYGRCRNEAAAFRVAAARGNVYLGHGAAMARVWKTIDKVAGSRATVLLQGESGCGKEVVAAAIHQLSPDRDKPYICVNCAALDMNLLNSELFGHEKGAFTGATARRAGRFELACDGTLFLDEIGDADLAVQARLLRVLETRTYERLGSSESLRTNARILAATNMDLPAAIQAGKFREDLYHRLNVVSIQIPPLRERTNDIAGFLDFFAEHFAAEIKTRPIRFAPDAVDLLARYSWPGNVRELKNLVERTVVLADQPEIHADVLIELFPILQDLPMAPAASPRVAEHLWDMEKAALEQALAECHGNQSKAARKLGIARHHLRYRIRKFRIDTVPYGEDASKAAEG